jgi:hypothetical protein
MVWWCVSTYISLQCFVTSQYSPHLCMGGKEIRLLHAGNEKNILWIRMYLCARQTTSQEGLPVIEVNHTIWPATRASNWSSSLVTMYFISVLVRGTPSPPPGLKWVLVISPPKCTDEKGQLHAHQRCWQWVGPLYSFIQKKSKKPDL